MRSSAMTKTKDQPPIDLGSLDLTAASNKGFELELAHPVSRKPLGVFITVLGKDSSAFRDHTREKVNERLRRNFEAQRKGKDQPIPTIDQSEKEAAELLAAVTVSWRNVTVNGEALECTSANAKRLYLDHHWIREQVDEAVADLGNFMPD